MPITCSNCWLVSFIALYKIGSKVTYFSVYLNRKRRKRCLSAFFIILSYHQEHLNTCPMRRVVFVVMPFSLQSCLTETPVLVAMRDKESPLRTL